MGGPEELLDLSVQVLCPEAAAQALVVRPGPQQVVGVLAEERFPARLARPFEHLQRRENRPGRGPERLVHGIRNVSTNRVGETIGRFRATREPPANQEDSRFPEEVRRHDLARVGLRQVGLPGTLDDVRGIDAQLRIAATLQGPKRPEDSGRAQVDRLVRRTRARLVERVPGPGTTGAQGVLGVADDGSDCLARPRFAPRRGGKLLVPLGVEEHGATRYAVPRYRALRAATTLRPRGPKRPFRKNPRRRS